MTSSLARLFDVRLRVFVQHFRVPLIVALAVIVIATFTLKNLSEVSRIANAIGQANPAWGLAALLAQVAVVGLAGVSYKVVLGRLGHDQDWAWFANLHLKRHVVGTVTPMGGPASVYVFVRSLGDKGISADDSLFAAAIRSLTCYATSGSRSF